ncbi:carbamoyltransferase HypF [Motiliproteus sp. MSK22-1]|nr:carbamoyltransferase HypF [Motiliproteus sp. MSK22-1]
MACYRLRIQGEVQGVGFRPHVYQVAGALRLRGRVFNDGAGVVVEFASDQISAEYFADQLKNNLPPLAAIDSISCDSLDAEMRLDSIGRSGSAIDTSIDSSPGSVFDSPFYIDNSEKKGPVTTQVPADAATCDHCLEELFSPDNRRYRYPFINCTHCGPRYSIINKLPYDRAHTTMAAFEFCHRCQQEYQSPEDRRFHAQPNACPECGPVLWLSDSLGQKIACDDPIAETLKRIGNGDIVAIKGLGGYHLVCDADNRQAVGELRKRKRRSSKPLAVMAANLQSLKAIVKLNPSAVECLQSPAAPVVLLACQDREQPGDGQLSDNPLDDIAPGLEQLGVLLPYAPIHYLLFHQAAGCPAGTDWLHRPQSLRLVMTSANASGRPLVSDNQKALKELSGIADCLLMHDRDIYMRTDDSVVNCLQMSNGGLSRTVVRRGRGMAPKVVKLPMSGPQTIAVGGFYKNSVCVTKGDLAYVSQYIGDLDNPDNCRYLQEMISHFCGLFDIDAEQVACDLHPDFYSSDFARHVAAEKQIPLIKVQHHHAHAAAVAAEHQIQDSYLALTLDGLGVGCNGELWGGELLSVENGQMCRLGYLNPLTLPGGDKASREPWRLALALLLEQGQAALALQRYGEQPGYSVLIQMIEKSINCPMTSSAGRLFDTAASLLGICHHSSFEAEAAMKLEAAAVRFDRQQTMAECLALGEWTDTGLYQLGVDLQLDFKPLLLRLPRLAAEQGAALFHHVLIRGLADWCCAAADSTGIKKVILSGGCFLNQRLGQGVENILKKDGFNVFCANRLPPNDSGLALGQAWIAIEQSLSESNHLLVSSKR